MLGRLRGSLLLCLTVLAVACDPPQPPFVDAGPGNLEGDLWADAGLPPDCLTWPLEMVFGDGGTRLDGGAWLVNSAGERVWVEGVTAAPSLGCFTTTEERFPSTQSPTGPFRPLPPELFVGCSPSRPELCPASDAGVRPVPGRGWADPVPFPPFGEVVSAEPEGVCSAGQHWSFESGRYDPWLSSGVFGNGPVFGNNVSIHRLLPPGYVDSGPGSPLAAVGGDYWEFSRDIRQHGNWWVGSSDQRFSPAQRPGGRMGEHLSGQLVSPAFLLDADYLSFRIGGSAHASQRVELQVQSTGDADKANLTKLYQGVGTVELLPGSTVVVEPSPGWIVVRASSARVDGDHLRRTAIWDVKDFRGRTVRWRILDGDEGKYWINVDDFRCLAEPPANTDWLSPPTPGDRPVIGLTSHQQPLWGVTDSHAHVAANLTLGGHYIWGDAAADTVQQIYNCNNPVGAITQDGVVVRPALEQPNTVTNCQVTGELVAVIHATGLGACAVASVSVGWVPFVGPILSAGVLGACTLAVEALTVGLMTTPAVSTRTYHGAIMPTSGGLTIGPFLSFLVTLIKPDFDTTIHGITELQDWDQRDGRHSGFGLGALHQRYHHTMIRRAWEGGLRLMVVDALNNRAMEYVLDGTTGMTDWKAVHLTVHAVKRLVAPVGNPEGYAPGPLRDIAEIALTPADARRIITQNKLALILGTEVPELGKLRFAGDTLPRQVQDLYDLGIRKVTPIHATNNPLGGTGIFNDVYNSANMFLNLVADENSSPADGVWRPLTPVPIVMPGSMPFPFGGLGLGSFEILYSLQPTTPCATPEAADCPWNLRNDGWFKVRTPPTGLSEAEDFIGGAEGIQYRVGLEEAGNTHRVISAGDGKNAWFNPDLKYANKLDSMEWLLGRGPGGISRSSVACSLEGMFFPIVGSLRPSVMDNYLDHHQHANAEGLTAGGAAFAQALMARGMLIDTDHMGQQTRLDLHAQTRAFGVAAHGGESEYPVHGIHSDMRGYTRHGPVPLVTDDPDRDFRAQLGWGAETDKTPAELQRISRAGGAVSPGVNGVVIRDLDGLVERSVSNNCDYSTKAYAAKYLLMVKHMGGRGVTPSTDMNSPSPRMSSRFGGNACLSGDTAKRQRRDTWIEDGVERLHLPSAPRDWTPELYDRCRDNASKLPADRDPGCPSSANPQAQLLEFSGVEYDDYADPARRWTVPGWDGDPEKKTVIARRATELRDDSAMLPQVEQIVTFGGGGPLKQGRPMLKWRALPGGSLNTGWDVNLDGFSHVGMLPDVWQDLRNVGVTWEHLTPMFNSAEDYVRMWERSCQMARDQAVATGTPPIAQCL